MRALKIIGLIIVLILAIVLIVPYFLPDNVSITQETKINAKSQIVFRQVNNFANWKAWSPFESDSTMVDTFSGPEQGVGASRSWDGEESGAGSMTILESDPYLYIRNKIKFEPDGGGVGIWNFAATDEGTKVSWNIHILDLGYFGRWFGLFAKYSLKPTMKDGLEKLKEVAEAMPEPPKVKKIIMDPKPTLVIFDSAKMDGMDEMFERNYVELMAYVKRMNIPVTGMQFAVYHNWNPAGYTKISCGVPVDKEYKGKGRVKPFELPGGEAVFARHIGGYNTALSHYEIDNYIKDFNLETRDFIWETYLYNPIVDTDSTKWETRIFYPLM
jgi:effector-binding domain-containing protein